MAGNEDRGARRVLERLSGAECMELISNATVGRLVYTSRYGPVARPFEYKIHEGSIVFRTYRAIFTEEDLAGRPRPASPRPPGIASMSLTSLDQRGLLR